MRHRRRRRRRRGRRRRRRRRPRHRRCCAPFLHHRGGRDLTRFINTARLAGIHTTVLRITDGQPREQTISAIPLRA